MCAPQRIRGSVPRFLFGDPVVKGPQCPTSRPRSTSNSLNYQAKIVAVIDMLVAEFPPAAVHAPAKSSTARSPRRSSTPKVHADEARANAIGQLITAAGQMLATVETPAAP